MTEVRLEKFEDLLDRYGADLDYWPEQDRRAGRALLSGADQGASEAQALLREAQALERMLDCFDAPAPSDGLVQATLDQVSGVPRARGGNGWLAALSGLFPGIPLWRPASAMLVAAVAGFYIGNVHLNVAGMENSQDVLAYQEQMLALSLGEAEINWIGEE